MPPTLVAALIERAQQLWGFTDTVEITLEANPSSVEAARFAALAQAGVNRISLGIQALDDDSLRFLGRAHSAFEALDALAVAQAHFARVSCDLIYARPDQSIADWRAELTRALAFGSEHLSLYQLTIEDGTRFASDVRRGTFAPAADEHAANLFTVTQELCDAAGLPAYEISNHARPGGESRHNLTYWRYQDYLGIGPGAHGRRMARASQRHKKPENYLSAVERNGHGLHSEATLSPQESAAEAMLMGLRLREGVDLAALSARLGLPTRAFVDHAKIGHLVGLGLLTMHGERLCVQPGAMILLDSILAEIVRLEPESAK
jgi:oxygen-independent coproporphyrinogen-3 oxidase